MNSEHYNQNKSLRPPPLADHHHNFNSANGSSLAYNSNNMGGQINPLFFPSTNSTFLNVAQKLPHDTLEAMLASKQLARGGSLQLIGDFEGGGEGHGANTSQEDERVKRQPSFSNPRSNYKGEGTNNNNNMYIDLGGGSRGGGEEAHTLSMDYMNMHMDEGVEYIDGDLGEHMKKGGVLGTTTRRLGYEQVKALEKAFEVENRLEPERKVKLASQLGLQPRQVAVWFQNRRARWKTKQMERDYTVLKNKFEALKADRDKLIQEKDQLQAELSRLKGHDMEDKKVGDQDSPTLASCSLVDDASHQVNVEDQGHAGKASLDEKLENDSLSRTEDSGNVNGDIEDSSSMLQGQSSLKPVNNEETDLYNHHNNHWRLAPSQSYYKNNIKNEEWENGEQGPLNMPMEWYHNW